MKKNMEEHFNNQIENNYNSLKEVAGRTDGISGVATGFRAFDMMTSGFQKGNLITIASAPSMGSTSFALSMLRNVSVTNRKPSLYVSLSMTERELVDRMIVNVCGISGEKIKNGQLSPSEWGQLDFKIKELYDSPMYIISDPFMHIDKLLAFVREYVTNNHIEILVIDYLQRLYAQLGYTDNRYLEINHFTRVLKSLALELDIPIVLISQINRNLDVREGINGKRPVLSDLRDSGTIEGDSDMVVFIHRPEHYHIYHDEKGNDLRGMAEIIIAKHRNGAVGDVLLRFCKEYARFENLVDEYVPMPGEGLKQ